MKITCSGKIILVNRGWIPRNKLATWKETDSSKHLTSIVGYYRTSQEVQKISFFIYLLLEKNICTGK